MSNNPKNIKPGDLVRIPGGRGHNRGFFHVLEVEDFSPNSAGTPNIRRYWYYKDRDFTEIRCIRVAWEDGRPSNGKKKMAFIATEVEPVNRQTVTEECDEAIKSAQEKRDCIIELIEQLET